MVAKHFVIDEEECFVPSVVDFGNPHGAARSPAEIVFPVDGTSEGEGTTGIERLVGKVLVAGAVELVGARAGREVVETARDLTEFGCEITGLQRELLDHLHRGLGYGAGPARIVCAV